MSSQDMGGAASGAMAGFSVAGPVGAVIGGLMGAFGSRGARRRERRRMEKILAERRARKAAKIKYAHQASRDTNLDNKAALNASLQAYKAVGAGAMTGGPGGMLRALYSQNAGMNRVSRRTLARDLSAAEDIGIYEGFDPSGGAAAEGKAMANAFGNIGKLGKSWQDYNTWNSNNAAMRSVGVQSVGTVGKALGGPWGYAMNAWSQAGQNN